MRSASQRVYPVVSLIVVMASGNVTGFILEDMTEACSGNATVEPILDMRFPNMTQNPYAYCPLAFCNATSNSDGICDPKVFVSWMGTDNSGTNLISSSQRFMNFKNYNLAGMWQSILGVSSRANSTDVYIWEPNEVNSNVTTRLANPPPTNLTALGTNLTSPNSTNGTPAANGTTTNGTTTNDTATNSTNTTAATG